MKLPKFLRFENKEAKRNKELLKLYEEGKYLRVDEDIDNKQLMLSPQLSDKGVGVHPVPTKVGDNNKK